MEGRTVASDLDIHKEAGKNRAYDVSIPVELADGVLSIAFVAKKGDPKLNAISIAEYKFPPTAQMTADPGTIPEGGTSALTWQSTRADSAFIEPGIGAVPVNGSFQVSPAEDTTYTITVTGPGGSATARATVKVSTSPEMLVITTVAGSAERGYGGDAGPATAAKLDSPSGVAVDAAGNLYIADNHNYLIRQVDADAIIRTVAGNYSQGCWDDGFGPATAIGDPAGLAADHDGNLYLVDSLCHRVRKLDPEGMLTRVAGSLPPCCFTDAWSGGYGGDGGPATGPEAALSLPRDVAVDALGNFYIADTKNNRIRKVDAAGVITTVAGNGERGYGGDGGPAVSAGLDQPGGVAVDSLGNLYISDTENQRIRKVDLQGKITTIAGNGSLCFKSGKNSALQEGVPAIQSCFGYPHGMALDLSGNLYIADPYFDQILKVDTAGILHILAGTGEKEYGGDGGPAREAKLHGPASVALDAFGNLYIADQWNHRIRKVQGVFKPTLGVVRGNVYVEGTNPEPMAGVKVKLVDSSQKTFSTQTNPQGNFGVSGVAPGEFTATFEKPGYLKRTEKGTCPAGQAISLTVNLGIFPSLEIRIESPTDGAAVYGTPVVVSGKINRPAEVKVNGISAAVSGISFSASVTLVEAWNSIVAQAEDETGDFASDSISVNLVVRGTVRGKVTDASGGLPLADVTVTLTDTLGVSKSATTDGNGNYTIAGILAGPFAGDMKKGGYQPHLFAGTIGPGQTVSLDGTLSRSLPKINNIQVKDITTDSATITWETDQPADGQVDYGPTPSYGGLSYRYSLTTSHAFTLTGLSPGTIYHYRVTSASEYGFSSFWEDQTFKTSSPPMEIDITYPAPGETIRNRTVTVMGRVYNPAGGETGVVVNGIRAVQGRHWFLPGNWFAANHVPLKEGENIVEAVATDADGQRQKTSPIPINALTTGDYVRIDSSVEESISPLGGILKIEGSLDLSANDVSCQGLGEMEYTTISAKEWKIKLDTVGMFFCMVKKYEGGYDYEDTVGIAVMSQGAMDALLRAKWEGMREHLAGRDIESALIFFHETTKPNYRKIFQTLELYLPQIAPDMSDIQLIECENGKAIYDLQISRDEEEYSYQLLFTTDSNGLWRIQSF